MLDAAIVGLGRWRRVLVSSVQGKSDRIRFVRGVTRRPALAKDFAREQGFTLDDDYAAALADPMTGAVVLATPHSRHVGQVVQAATDAVAGGAPFPSRITRCWPMSPCWRRPANPRVPNAASGSKCSALSGHMRFDCSESVIRAFPDATSPAEKY